MSKKLGVAFLNVLSIHKLHIKKVIHQSLEFRKYHNSAYLFFKLSESTFYKKISKF